MLGFVLAQVPWAGGAVELQKQTVENSSETVQKQFRNKLPPVCSWKMKSGKTGNKAAASSVCHRLISTIECEFNHGPAVPLCVTVLGIAVPGWRSSIPAKTCGQLK